MSSDVMTQNAIEVCGIGKRYRLGLTHAGSVRELANTCASRLAYPWRWLRGRTDSETPDVREFWALRDISFDVPRGEVVGIVGRNGAGKSTLLKILSRITPPTEGEAILRGRLASLLEVGTGFHPELTGRENVYLNGTILGMTRAEIRARFDQIVDFSGVGQFIDTPVKRYSSGMLVRLAFGVAAHLDPEILIVDEVLAVGDFEFQKRCLGRMEELSRSGRTVLFVSHNLRSVRDLTSRVVLLHAGRVEFVGPTAEGLKRYQESLSDAPGIGDVEHLPRPFDDLRGGARMCDLSLDGVSTDSRGRSTLRAGLGIRNDSVTSPVRLGLTIFQADETPVGSTFSTDFSLPVGEQTTWDVVLPDLPLAPGAYSCAVSLALAGQGGNQLEDSLAHVLPFEVPELYESRQWGPGWGSVRLAEMGVRSAAELAVGGPR